MSELFTPQSVKFFRDLKRNNRRDWYQENKDRYEEYFVEPARELLKRLDAQPALKRVKLKSSKASLFRLHRDTRFTNDKSPLKTSNGIMLTRAGSKDDPGCLYFHFEPGHFFVAVGFYHPEPNLLSRFRVAASEKPRQAVALKRQMEKAKFEFYEDDALKRLPRGFEQFADDGVAPLLRGKHWVVQRDLDERVVLGPKLADALAKAVSEATPLLKWGWPLADRWRMETGTGL